jgi:hypothetical protein
MAFTTAQARMQHGGPRLTIALVDRRTGWLFRLHAEAQRVWVDSLETDAPVPLAYVAGERRFELEAACGRCRDLPELLATAQDILPSRIVARPLAEVREAA